jgi:hypothetical protein
MCAWAYGTIYTWRPEMDLKSLLESLFESLLESLLERASHRERYSFPQEAFGRWETLSL